MLRRLHYGGSFELDYSFKRPLDSHMCHTPFTKTKFSEQLNSVSILNTVNSLRAQPPVSHSVSKLPDHIPLGNPLLTALPFPHIQ